MWIQTAETSDQFNFRNYFHRSLTNSSALKWSHTFEAYLYHPNHNHSWQGMNNVDFVVLLKLESPQSLSWSTTSNVIAACGCFDRPGQGLQYTSWKHFCGVSNGLKMHLWSQKAGQIVAVRRWPGCATETACWVEAHSQVPLPICCWKWVGEPCQLGEPD